jgi:hypothetical protein
LHSSLPIIINKIDIYNQSNAGLEQWCIWECWA